MSYRQTGPRHSARVKKVSNRELMRRAEYSIREGGKQYALLLAVLAQSGGEVTVTQGTIDQVGMNLPNLGYVVVGGKAEKEFIVRLTEGHEDAPESPTSHEEAPEVLDEEVGPETAPDPATSGTESVS
jgi:hypothetical protein